MHLIKEDEMPGLELCIPGKIFLEIHGFYNYE